MRELRKPNSTIRVNPHKALGGATATKPKRGGKKNEDPNPKPMKKQKAKKKTPKEEPNEEPKGKAESDAEGSISSWGLDGSQDE